MTAPAICISPACLADCSAIQQLVNRAYASPHAARSWTNESGIVSGQRVRVADVEQLLTTPHTTLLVAKQDGAIIGSVTLIYGEDYSKLNMLAVDPAYQQYGIGKQLLAYSEQFLRQHYNSRKLRIDVVASRVELIAFYQRRGFINLNTPYPYPVHLVATTPLEEGLMVEVLEKDLQSPLPRVN